MTKPVPLHFHTLWFAVGVALIILVVYLSLTSSPPDLGRIKFGDKLGHLLAYGVLMGWFGQLYTATSQQLRWFFGFCLMGIGLEFLQWWGGVRQFEFMDMAANVTGVVSGWWLTRGWFAGSLRRFDGLVGKLLG